MSENDRYAHLKYIRDNMISSIHRTMQIKQWTSNSERQKISESAVFYNKLNSLRCIGQANTVLLPVSAFCDHTQEVFSIFPDDFKVLPEVLKDHMWLVFFKKLHLKTSLSAVEYIKYCRKIAKGEVRDISKASDVFIQYLLEIEESLGDPTLTEISNISFVCARHPSEVSWLLKGHTTAHQLVKMNGSALLRLQHQLWTVRPLITLPNYTETLTDKLGVISSPSAPDVVANITNISKTSYSDERLFSKYPQNLKPPGGDNPVSNLLCIMLKNFQWLDTKSDISTLKLLPCIPVYTEKQNYDGYQVALVKPNSVIKNRTLSDDFHPYLYGLPTEFLSLYDVLDKIGVSTEISIQHMQILLERVFLQSNGKPISINTQNVVHKAIEILYKSLQLTDNTKNLDETVLSLTPLYLPDVNNTLQVSTTMLYADTSSYYGYLRLKLQGTSKSQFDPKSKYGIFANDLCKVLPKSIRPLKLSKQCIQIPDQECVVTQNSHFAISLLKSFQDKSCPENLKNAITRFIGEQKKGNLIKEEISKIFKSMKVTTMNNLHAVIKLKDTAIEIGRLQVDYIFHEADHHLYLDEDVMMGKEKVSFHIVNYTLKAVFPLLNKQLKPGDEKDKLIHFWSFFLTCSAEEKIVMLDKLQITGVVDNSSENVDLFQLGVAIPLYWQDRLDQDADNMYNPMEFVGYEIKENKIIMAQIVYLVQSEQPQSVYCKKYKIYINDNDEDGIEVSILKLYKFLEGDKRAPLVSNRVGDDSAALVPHDGGNDLTNLRASFYQRSAASKRKLICDQLREIWQLPEDLRRSAIRRIYFRYHPDKNPDNAEEYEDLCIFLTAQIDHLEKGEPLDDPEREDRFQRASRSRSQDTTTTTWKTDFDDWNATLGSQRRSRSRRQQNCDEEMRFPFNRHGEDIARPNPSEGRRWLRQAEHEFAVLNLCLLHADDTKGYAHVCFLSHEVVEKALKGGLYALCGLDARKIESHQLSNNAHALRTIRPHEARRLSSHCIPLEEHYLNTRFPNRWPGRQDAPYDHYHLQDAQDAKEHAAKVLDIVKSIMPQE